jgi:hypothetical protein
MIPLTIVFILASSISLMANDQDCSKHKNSIRCTADRNCTWKSSCINKEKTPRAKQRSIGGASSSVYDPNPNKRIETQSIPDPRTRRSPPAKKDAK